VFLNTTIPAGQSKAFHLMNGSGCDSTINILAGEWPGFKTVLNILASCPNKPTGAIQVTGLSGGKPPFAFSINPISWQDSLHFNGLYAGGYTVSIQDAYGCLQQEHVAVPEVEPLQVELPSPGALSCDTPQIILQPFITGDTTDLRFKWSDGTNGSSLTVDQPGAYTLQVSNRCETAQIKAAILESGSRSGGDYVYVPNVFAPESNMPGNDRFQPAFSASVFVLNYRLELFDRWGSLLFRSTDPNQDWDGKVLGQFLTPQVVVWRLDATVNWCGRDLNIRRAGDVTIVR
jgi:hypothetical protein